MSISKTQEFKKSKAHLEKLLKGKRKYRTFTWMLRFEQGSLNFVLRKSLKITSMNTGRIWEPPEINISKNHKFKKKPYFPMKKLLKKQPKRYNRLKNVKKCRFLKMMNQGNLKILLETSEKNWN